MRFGSIAHAQQFTKETRLIVTSSKNSGQIQAPCRLTLSMINLMMNEAGMVAGNRSDEDFNDEVPFDLPTKDGFDRAIFLPNTSSSKKLAAQKMSSYS